MPHQAIPIRMESVSVRLAIWMAACIAVKYVSMPPKAVFTREIIRWYLIDSIFLEHLGDDHPYLRQDALRQAGQLHQIQPARAGESLQRFAEWSQEIIPVDGYHRTWFHSPK